MNLLNKYMLLCAVVLTIAPIMLSTFSSDNITATDWVYRHSAWINRYLKGDTTPIFEYPPLFEWLLLPFVAIKFPMKYFQIIFSALSISSILYMAYKLESEKTLLYTSMFLATSIAYVSFAGALMPQALDYFLFPVALLFYFRNRIKPVIIILLYNFFMHMTGFIFLGILFIHSFATKRYKTAKILFILIIFLSPFFIYYEFFSKSNLATVWDYKAQAEWESQYLDPLWVFFGASGFLVWLSLPFAVKRLYKKKFKLSETQSLYIIWIGAFFSFIIFRLGIWRMISYQIVPLSLLIASILGEKMNQKYKNDIEKRFIELFGEEK